ncbi:MAG: S49 family peptidase [Calditrichaeota bacterium]|nr:S49 family peptidase [Calditrichota bacterium]
MRARLVVVSAATALLWSVSAASAQAPLPFSQAYDVLLPAPPGALGNGLLGYFNPAVLSYVHGPELRGVLVRREGALRQWGLFTAAPHLGFGMLEDRSWGGGVRYYRAGVATGGGGLSVGAGYGWSSSGGGQVWYGGFLARPVRFVSLGLAGWHAQRRDRQEVSCEVGLRPLGTDVVTLFADASVQGRQRVADGRWSVGAALQPVTGIYVVGRYFRGGAFTVGLSASLGRAGFAVQRRSAKGDNPDDVAYTVRLGKATPNLVDSHLLRGKCWLPMELKGAVVYQRQRLLDVPGHKLSDLLFTLQDAAEDPRVAVVAVNLSGVDITAQLAWELRRQLAEVRRAGKKVIAYIDRGDMTEYHLASVADWVVMDPEGMLTLLGYVTGRTFLKGTLDKLGIGYEEWRYFKYKSATEVLSREQMSEADREQRLAWLQDQYSLVRDEVAASRGFSPAYFDSLINNVALFLPEQAVRAQLADTVARWKDIEQLLVSVAGGKKKKLAPAALASRQYPPVEWGSRPQVAVVYAIGECDMDQGINARQLEKVLLRLAERRRVKAVVVRVDSPGGDALASDLVAEAMKKCREKKPVIVSQGSVAGSGGYWLSMYGETIVSTPATITGSIGVIGGWLWNKGLGERLGMSSDHVQVGAHADLGFGITLPLLGVRIPDRRPTPQEQERLEQSIRTMYREFVNKVAQGRRMQPEAVEEVAQGRIWSGVAAKSRGLVDVLGGLQDALQMAKQRAQVPARAKVEVVELPRPGLINPEVLMPKLAPLSTSGFLPPQEARYLRILARFPGQPLPMLPPDFLLVR